MRRVTLLIPIFLFYLSTPVYALQLSFEYSGVIYGNMSIEAMDATTLRIEYFADSPLPDNAEVTGFAFSFIPNDIIPTSIDNPTDEGDPLLTWVILNNLNPIPNPTNDTSVTKFDFYFGVTAGNPNNFTPPGITAGNSDVFYLIFANPFIPDVSGFVEYAGIRIQSLPGEINGGSLFLVNSPATTPIPEPSTMMLFGVGILGAFIARKKFKR
jgi:hypothetical protein